MMRNSEYRNSIFMSCNVRVRFLLLLFRVDLGIAVSVPFGVHKRYRKPRRFDFVFGPSASSSCADADEASI